MQNLVSNAENHLQAFDYSGNKVRALQIDGEPWFVLRDVCGALGISHVKDTADRLDADEVGQTDVTDSIGRNQLTTIINESGLYNVILRSDKPEAKPFRKWVTAEVLPSIRRTGSYSVRPMSTAQMLLAQAQWNVEQEQRIDAIEAKSDAMTEKLEKAVTVFALPTVEVEAWRGEMNRHINMLCERYGLNYSKFRGDTYKELEKTAGVNLESRQTRMKGRMRKAGAKSADCSAITKLHVISEDKKLRPLYEGIIRRREAQMLVCRGVE